MNPEEVPISGASRAGPLAGARRLRADEVRSGDRWVYSAGFNTDPELEDPLRVDCELADLGSLLGGGARVAILAHQGRFADGTAGPLDGVARYLSGKLARPVRYVETPVGDVAVRSAARLRPGEAILFGNTRLLCGEEENDPELAREFAKLGRAVAVGGFSKAHRAHASNVGILDHLPGYAATSLAHEFDRLTPWAEGDLGGSVAVIGGYKHEKVTVALRPLLERYGVIVPSGTVLIKFLLAMGVRIGASDPGEKARTCVAAISACLDGRLRQKLRFPGSAVIARRERDVWTGRRALRFGEPVPDGFAIVDVALGRPLTHELTAMAARGGRFLLAGTPGRVTEGFRAGTEEVVRILDTGGENAIVVGGDSVTDTRFRGVKSGGGGAALEFVATGESVVAAALRKSAGGCYREL